MICQIETQLVSPPSRIRCKEKHTNTLHECKQLEKEKKNGKELKYKTSRLKAHIQSLGKPWGKKDGESKRKNAKKQNKKRTNEEHVFSAIS